MRRFLYLLVLCFLTFSFVFGQETIPCRGTTTAVLNVRSGPGTDYSRIGQLRYGTEVKVVEKVNHEWVRIEYASGRAYVNSSYLKFSPLLQPTVVNSSTDRTSSGWSFWNIVWKLISWGLGIYISIVIFYCILRILRVAYGITSNLLRYVFKLVSLPFFFLNTLQRYLAKPWIVFLKQNHFSDETNKVLRIIFSCLKVPLYFLLFPVRFVNAFYFNIVVHCLFEMFNYIMEVIFPSSYNEGCGGAVEWLVNFPSRVVKYLLWHGSLTIIESVIWTLGDVLLPALTLFHGTSSEAADCIVASPDRGKWRGQNTGIWQVGTGNYAGNGIYFAPARSTAEHYSRGSLIICRVTLGNTLDLGIAPYRVFRECGNANALEATDWGLKNGYVAGEWWRPDSGWWEYCMYDWQNRYNYSWRIRPLYVIDLYEGNIQRIHGGMCHWLFRKLVIKDIMTSLREWL